LTLLRANYSTFSSISGTIDPSAGELLDFLEHLGHDRPFRRRITRLSRVTRARSTLPWANYSIFSSNSGTIDPYTGELLDFLEYLGHDRPFHGRITRLSRASRARSTLPRANYSTFSSNSGTIDPSMGELLDFLEHLGHDRPFHGRITRLSRATRARSTLPRANYSTFSSNSGTIDPSTGELLDFLE
jgi:hypothetical protein